MAYPQGLPKSICRVKTQSKKGCGVFTRPLFAPLRPSAVSVRKQIATPQARLRDDRPVRAPQQRTRQRHRAYERAPDSLRTHAAASADAPFRIRGAATQLIVIHLSEPV